MKRWLGMAGLVLVGTAGWRVGDLLSPDALSLAIGVLIGVLAGLPAALLLLANRRNTHILYNVSHDPAAPAGWQMAPQAYRPQQALPFVQEASHGDGWARGYAWQPPQQTARAFKVVGEREEWLEEWH